MRKVGMNSCKNNDNSNKDHTDRTRLYTKILILMLLCYGIIGLIMFAITNIVINFSEPNKVIGVYTAIIHDIRFVLLIIFILAFGAMRNSLKKNRCDRLHLLDIWAIITLFIPFLKIVIAVAQIAFKIEIEDVIIYNFPYNIISVMQYSLTAIGLLITGYEFGRKSYLYSSLIMLLICPIIFIINIDTKTDNIYTMLLILEDRCKYLMAVNYIVYIIIGFSAQNSMYKMPIQGCTT